MGVSMHWRDLGQRKQPGVWAGLLLDVSACTPPAFTVSVCPPHCLRVAVGDRAMLWARVDKDYWGVDLLRSDSPLSPGIVPPITAAQVRERHAADPARARAGWARFFAEALAESGRSPLADGQWLLQPSLHGSAAVSIRPDMAALALARPALDALDWSDITFGSPFAPIPLRSPSPAQNGRVNAWARHARAGTLPPVLLMWVSGLQAHVVLDGHDRLQAAVQQGKPSHTVARGARRAAPTWTDCTGLTGSGRAPGSAAWPACAAVSADACRAGAPQRRRCHRSHASPAGCVPTAGG